MASPFFGTAATSFLPSLKLSVFICMIKVIQNDSSMLLHYCPPVVFFRKLRHGGCGVLNSFDALPIAPGTGTVPLQFIQDFLQHSPHLFRSYDIDHLLQHPGVIDIYKDTEFFILECPVPFNANLFGELQV